MRYHLTWVVVLLAVATSSGQRATASDPVTLYLAKTLGAWAVEAAIDELYDAATGKPNLKEIDRRLKTLEDSAALRSEMREEIRRVRDGLNERVTKEELRAVLTGLQSQLTDIRRRISALEERVELQEVEIDDQTHRDRDL